MTSSMDIVENVDMLIVKGVEVSCSVLQDPVYNFRPEDGSMLLEGVDQQQQE